MKGGLNSGRTAPGGRLASLRHSRMSKRLLAAAFTLFRLALLVSIGYIILYPLLYMISVSIKTDVAFRNPSIVWIPTSVTGDNFAMAYDVMDYTGSLLSTLRLEVVSALIQVFSCAVAAYGFARFNFRGKKLLMFILMLMILIPPQVLIIPLVNNFSHLDFLGVLGLFQRLTGVDIRPNVLDTVWSFYLPSLLGVGLRAGILIFIYYQFFCGLPKELEEAAWIDGSNPFRTFISIALPSSSVVILTVTVLSLVWHWNDYYLAVMYTSENLPLAVSLANLTANLTTVGVWGGDKLNAVTMAGSLMFILPLLVFYILVQNRFIKSIDRVGITG